LISSVRSGIHARYQRSGHDCKQQESISHIPPSAP
jgi:hypothetical protein